MTPAQEEWLWQRYQSALAFQKSVMAVQPPPDANDRWFRRQSELLWNARRNVEEARKRYDEGDK